MMNVVSSYLFIWKIIFHYKKGISYLLKYYNPSKIHYNKLNKLIERTYDIIYTFFLRSIENNNNNK